MCATIALMLQRSDHRCSSADDGLFRDAERQLMAFDMIEHYDGACEWHCGMSLAACSGEEASKHQLNCIFRHVEHPSH